MPRIRLFLLLCLFLGSLLSTALLGAPGVVAQPDTRCFAETGYCIAGRLRTFWEQQGGLALFGLPISEQQAFVINGRLLQVQWFERSRLELHPQEESPYDVQLGRVGEEVLSTQGRDWYAFPPDTPRDGCRFFAETHQNVCGDILQHWQAAGLELGDTGISEAESLALFGLPISPLQEEELDGHAYQVQWFERARFELHPENPSPFEVQLGLLGRLQRAVERPRGRLVIAGAIDHQSDLYLLNSDGSDPIQLTSDPATDNTPVWSPDGTRIIFTSHGENELADLFVITPDGRHRFSLAPNPALDWQPTWSPGGQHIAFISNRKRGGWRLYTINADGSNLMPLVEDLDNVGEPTWSPDGTRLAFYHGTIGNGVVYILNADGTGLQRIADGSRPQWSPDGTQLTYYSPFQEDLTNSLFISNADGSHPIAVVTARYITTPAWSPDGHQIVFSASDDMNNGDIFVVNTDGTELQQLTHTPKRNDFSPTWSPDGSLIAYVSVEGNEFPSYGIFVMKPDGSQKHFLMEEPPFRGNLPPPEHAGPEPLPADYSAYAWGATIETLDGARGITAPWVLGQGEETKR